MSKIVSLFLVSWQLPTLHACQFVLYRVLHTHTPPLPHPSFSSLYFYCDLWFGWFTKLTTVAAIKVLSFDF